MKKEIKEKKEQAFSTINLKSFLSVVIILVAIITITGILTLFIPQGQFLRDDNGEIIAGTFTKGEANGIAVWRVLTAPFRVFFADGGITIIMISLFLLIMSGIFNLLDKTAIVAFPIGYACMKPWLEQYVVQTKISWWIYVGIFLMVALLVALCVGWRVWKTAKAHPADEIAKGRG